MPKNAKKAKKATKGTVGRPRAEVTIPNGRFTFKELCIANGALKADGSTFSKKEKKDGLQKMVPLTLKNHMDRDAKRGSQSMIVRLKELGKNDSENGKGRKPFLYMKRAQAGKATAKAKAKATKATASVTVPIASVLTTAPVTPAPAPTPAAAPATADPVTA